MLLYLSIIMSSFLVLGSVIFTGRESRRVIPGPYRVEATTPPLRLDDIDRIIADLDLHHLSCLKLSALGSNCKSDDSISSTGESGNVHIYPPVNENLTLVLTYLSV